MDKIAVGAGLPDGIVDLDKTPAENIGALAHALGRAPSDVVACILDRPRHAKIIEEVRAADARVRLIPDGDIAGVIATSDNETGIDIYLGIGGAPEGVLAAAALSAIGGAGVYRVLSGIKVTANSESRPGFRFGYGLTDYAILNVESNAEIVFTNTVMELKGGTILGSGEVLIGADAELIWEFGAIGLTDVGASSAHVVVKDGAFCLIRTPDDDPAEP